MNGHNGHCIAKVQYFADMMKQIVLEKESLAVVVEDPSLRSDIRTEILIYNQVLEEYNKLFEDILHTE